MIVIKNKQIEVIRFRFSKKKVLMQSFAHDNELHSSC